MGNLDLYEKVRSVPEEAKRNIDGGRLKGKTDISPMWRIKVLTEQFGMCGIGWYYEVDKQWTESQNDETAAFVNIRLYVCVDGEWSKPIFGTGGSMLVELQKNGPYMSDECFKMATTDAISVACKQLGIGADVYCGADKSKYSMPQSQDKAKPDNVDKRFEEIEKELRRTGYAPKSLCMTYKLNDVYDMSDLQIKDCLQRLKKIPNKEVS